MDKTARIKEKRAMLALKDDNNTPKQALYKISEILKNSFDDDILFLPKEFDVVKKCSIFFNSQTCFDLIRTWILFILYWVVLGG